MMFLNGAQKQMTSFFKKIVLLCIAALQKTPHSVSVVCAAAVARI